MFNDMSGETDATAASPVHRQPPHTGAADATPRPRPASRAAPAIGMNSVESIDDLSGGGMNPVWLVSLRGTPVKLVAKAEIEQNASEVAFAKANIKAVSDVMAVVSPTAVMVRLEPGELETLDTFPARPLTLRTAVKEARHWIESYGQHIKDKSKLPKMGREIVQSINKYRMIPLGLASYTMDEERYLGEGLIQGWDKLANNIGMKVRSGIGIPSGLMAQARYLGFVQ